MVKDLQAEQNQSFRLFEKFSSESKLVTIASISLIVSLLALLMGAIATYAALSANIKVESQNDDIQGYREAVEIEKNRVAKYRLEVEQLMEQKNER